MVQDALHTREEIGHVLSRCSKIKEHMRWNKNIDDELEIYKREIEAVCKTWRNPKIDYIDKLSVLMNLPKEIRSIIVKSWLIRATARIASYKSDWGKLVYYYTTSPDNDKLFQEVESLLSNQKSILSKQEADIRERKLLEYIQRVEENTYLTGRLCTNIARCLIKENLKYIYDYDKDNLDENTPHNKSEKFLSENILDTLGTDAGNGERVLQTFDVIRILENIMLTCDDLFLQ
jgi:hypothetical protein